MIEQLPPTLAQEHKSPLPADVDHPELPSPVGRPESPDEDVNADLAPDTEQAMVPIQQQAPDNQPWRIISEWNEIELQFNLIGELLGANTRNGSTLMNLLLRREYVSNEAVELFETLRKARSRTWEGNTKRSSGCRVRTSGKVRERGTFICHYPAEICS